MENVNKETAAPHRLCKAATFELSGLQEFLPLRADLLHAVSNLTGGIMLLLQEVLARLLQVYPALVGRQLCFKRLVFLHLTLQVGGVLSAKGTLIKTSIKEQKSSNKCPINYFVSFICGRLHLLIDPALQLIRVPEELLQKGRIPQGSTAGLSALVQGITAAEQLQMATESEFHYPSRVCV